MMMLPMSDVWPLPPMPLPPMREPEPPPEVAEPPLPVGPVPVREPGREPGGFRAP